MKKHFLFALFLLFLFTQANGTRKYTVGSPDGKLVLTIYDDGKKQCDRLKYQLDYKNTPVVLPSDIGIGGWQENLTVKETATRSVDFNWTPVYGERAQVRDHFNEKTLKLKREGRTGELRLVVRAYNEGIAFRYVCSSLGAADTGRLRISSEKTNFRFAEGTMAWVTYRAQHDYELLPLRAWTDAVERPLTLQLKNGLFACITEAELVNYSRTKFVIPEGEENLVRCQMDSPVELPFPSASPWRVIMVAEKPTGILANNDLILKLNAPCQIEDTSWIKPGKVIRSVSLTTEGAKKVVDLAVRRNLQYILFDAGWYGRETDPKSDPTKSDVDPERSPVNDLSIPEVVEYAKSKKIGVWLYVNRLALENHLDEILPLYQKWGIAGIKFGFVNVGSQYWTKWVHDAVVKCAAHRLMVDIHDEYRPTGFSRTYPNLLTQEGIRGNEEFPDGRTNTVLPFTRFVAGAADATICYFHRKEFKPWVIKSNPNARMLENTACHQMALAVINYSPLQFLYWYDTPGDFQDVPELAFFDEVSTVWDDTRIVTGEIGKFISIARRKGDTWFVGCITNNEARKMTFPLDFLEPGKEYEMTVYSDGGEEVETKTRVVVAKRAVNRQSVFENNLLPRGGCAMIIQLSGVF
ncbi:MAG: glycoside hydrolase family 97 catalytic domain-containing protein [Mangrovibacterium sp.]